jgi:hypothetical protein
VAKGWHNIGRTRRMPTLAVNPLRTAALLTLLAGGCVIPVAPQFDDPESNYPPYVVTSTPMVGDIFTPGMTTQDRDISAALSDQNLHDTLFIRFLIDYPGTDTSTAHLFFLATLPPSGANDRGSVHVRPECARIGIGPGMHRLMMSVSDRPYLDALVGDDVDPEAPLDSVPESANRIRVVWTLFCPGT